LLKLGRLHARCKRILGLSVRYRCPPEIILHAVWLYYRFTLGLRDVEDLLAERGIGVSCEAVRLNGSCRESYCLAALRVTGFPGMSGLPCQP